MPEKKKRFSLNKAPVDMGQVASHLEDENDAPYGFNPKLDPTAGRLPTHSLTKPSKKDEEAAMAATGGTIGALGGMLSGGLAAPAVGAAMGSMFPPRNTAELTADATGSGVQMVLDSVAPGSGTAAMGLKKWLGKEGAKSIGKRMALEGATTGATQLPLIATGQSDPGQAASLMVTSAGGPAVAEGMARGLGAALGLTRPNDIVKTLNRIRARTGEFANKFGLTAETGGTGLKALEFMRGGLGSGGYERNYQEPLQELMMKGLKQVGALGEVPMTKEVVRRAEDELGIVFNERSVEEIQNSIVKRVTKKSITEVPEKRIKQLPQRDPVSGKMIAQPDIIEPAKKRSIQGDDIIAVDPETGRIFASAEDQPLKIPKAIEDRVELFRVDKAELNGLMRAAQRDPGAVATLIGRSNRNLPMTAALKRFLPAEEWRAIQRDWLGQHLIADALVASSKKQGGVNMKKVFGESDTLDANTFMQLDGDSLRKAWGDIKSQKKLLMLEPKQVMAVDDIVTVVNELGIGNASKLSQEERVVSYLYNKFIFSGLSMGAAGRVAGFEQAGNAAMLGATVLLSLNAATTAALTNPDFARVMRTAAKGDIDAARQGIRMLASDPGLTPMMLNDNTVEFVPRPMEMAPPLQFNREEKRPQNLMERLQVR